MSRHRRSRKPAAVLVVFAFLLGFAGTPAATAQTEEGQPDLSQFGGYVAQGRSNAIQVTYDSPGLLPTGGAPILQVSVPEALANLNTGPVGFARSSFVFPGALIADFGSALEQTGTSGIPTYPIRNEAFFPSGPMESRTGEAGTETVATTEFADSTASGSYVGTVVPGLVGVGGVNATSNVTVEGDELVARTRTEISDLQLLGGLIGIESIVTDLVAVSNGSDAATDGGTTATGITVLGLRADLAEEGLRFVDPLPSSAPDADDPLSGLFGDLTGGATDEVLEGLEAQLQPVVDQLNEILATAGDETLTAAGPLLDMLGVSFNLFEAIETTDAGTADLLANGLGIRIDYDGANTPLVTDLLNAVPDDLLPNDNLGPIPFSVASIFAILQKVNVVSISLAPGNVSVAATPAFEVDIPEFTPSADVPIASTGGSSLPTSSGFSSSPPTLAAPGASQPQQPVSPVPVPVSSARAFPFGDALPLLLVVMAVLSSPLWASASRRLADNALAAQAGTCPDGLDTASTKENGR